MLDVLDFFYPGPFAPHASRAATPCAIPIEAGAPPVRSRFESMTLTAGGLRAKTGDVLGILLASTIPIAARGCEVLRPLWAEEAIHRAYSFIRLVDARNRAGEPANEHCADAGLGDAIARDLAVRFRELEVIQDREVLACSPVLRDVIADLGALFGSPANIAISAKTDFVSLLAYKRRALVLGASELVTNALLHAFPGNSSGRIVVSLTSHGPTSACLRVADNGAGFTDRPPNLHCGVAAGLAGLLEADLAYDRMGGWTIAEIVFPVSGFDFVIS